MNDPRRHEDREALLANEHVGDLDDGEAADLPLLADLLADPSTWSEPRAGFDDEVVHAVAEAAPAPPKTSTRRRWRLVTSVVGVAAAIVLVSGAVLVARQSTSPDFRAQLTASGVAPNARGSVDISKTSAGFRIVLDARGLPVLGNGEYYQAWLKSPAGTLVPVGTFSSSDGRVTMWSGVSPKDFRTITVTIESSDNNQSSSGRRVLTGEVRSS
jgi:hypothetical protein